MLENRLLHARGRAAGPYARAVALALAAALLTPLPGSAQQLYDFGTAFGRAAAVAGSEIVVGEPQNIIRPGRVYVFAQATDAWQQAQILTASDAARADGFGRAVAAAGSGLLVGAPQASDGSGAIYLFSRGAGGWREVARVGGSDGATGAGAAVALAPAFAAYVETSAAGEQVRILRRDAGTLTLETTLAGEPGDLRFGGALAVVGDDGLAVCGADASGAMVVDLFQRDPGGLWARTVRVAPGAPFSATGGLLSQDPYKECALAASGDVLAVGARLGGGGRGEVVLYRFDSGNGLVRDTALAAPQGAMGGFGTAVAVAGETLWVGAPDARGLMGAAMSYRRSGGAWTPGEVIQGPGTDFMPVFGLALAAGPDVAVVGSPGDAYGAGLAVAFRRNGVSWFEAGTLTGEVEGYDAVAGGQVDCASGEAAIFGCEQVDLVALLPVQEMGASRGAMVNDVWGWTDPETGREYAVVGRSEGTSFVDVTNPARPMYLGQLPKTEGSRGQAWRDVKVIRDHALVVADNAGQHGMQVFDLTRLRAADPAAPPVFEPDALYTDIASAHNLVVNEETGFAYIVGMSGGGRGCASLHIVDMTDPRNPTFAGCYNDLGVGLGAAGQTHDAQCVLYHGPDAEYRGREICFAFSETAISIGDVTDKPAPTILSQAQMPNTAYIHQGWLSEDQRYLYVNDELDEMSGLTDATRTIIWDVTELEDPVLAGVYLASSNATDHNLYIHGNLMYQSNYAAGLRIVDISDPVSPREVAYFDTAPFAADAPGFFDGSWSNYPFFRSGNILVTSHKQGLFVLKRRVPIS